MRLTRAGEYAVRCILYLARKGKGMLVSRQQVGQTLYCQVEGPNFPLKRLPWLRFKFPPPTGLVLIEHTFP